MDGIFCPAEVFVERHLPKRCFQCQVFGHTSTTCKRKSPVCANCGDKGHKAQECSKQVKRCVNCSGGHASYDKSCPVFIENLTRANFLEINQKASSNSSRFNILHLNIRSITHKSTLLYDILRSNNIAVCSVN